MVTIDTWTEVTNVLHEEVWKQSRYPAPLDSMIFASLMVGRSPREPFL